MLPSICCALQSANGEDSEPKYIRWYDRFIKDLFLKGKDCYKLRCSLLHQGKTKHKNLSFSGFRFSYPSKKLDLHNNNFGGDINLNIVYFCENMLTGVNKWLNEMENNSNYKANIQGIIKTHRDGFGDFIKGIRIPAIY